MGTISKLAANEWQLSVTGKAGFALNTSRSNDHIRDTMVVCYRPKTDGQKICSRIIDSGIRMYLFFLNSLA